MSRVAAAHPFPPSAGEIAATLGDLTGRRRLWLLRAEAMAAEHARRREAAAAAAAAADRQREIEAFRARLAGRSPVDVLPGDALPDAHPDDGGHDDA